MKSDFSRDKPTLENGINVFYVPPQTKCIVNIPWERDKDIHRMRIVIPDTVEGIEMFSLCEDTRGYLEVVLLGDFTNILVDFPEATQYGTDVYYPIDRLIFSLKDGKTVALHVRASGHLGSGNPVYDKLSYSYTAKKMDALCNEIFQTSKGWYERNMIALDRLMYPDTLSEESKEIYELFLTKNAHKAIAACCISYDLEGMRFLVKKELVTKKTIEMGVNFLFRGAVDSYFWEKDKKKYIDFAKAMNMDYLLETLIRKGNPVS